VSLRSPDVRSSTVTWLGSHAGGMGRPPGRRRSVGFEAKEHMMGQVAADQRTNRAQ
jgi:hypothetical protein